MARRIWSKKQIEKSLRLWKIQDPSLKNVQRDDQGLYYATFRFFGSWRNAMLAAGVKPNERRWSKQSVLEAIVARQHRSGSIRGITSEDPALYAAAHRHFGGWQQALRAAGLPGKPKQWLSRERVMADIQSLHQQGLPLGGLHKTNRSLLYAARKHFASWPAAVRAAGIPDGWQHTWTPQRLIAVLQACGQPGQPLVTRQVPAGPRNAACQYFGGWYAALAAAGRTPWRPPTARKKWTRETLLVAIRDRARRGESMLQSTTPGLASAATRYFGTWTAALRSAGLELQVRRTWTPQRVLDEIQALDRRGAFAESDRIEDQGLITAAKRRFGGWQQALTAAGVLLPYEGGRRSWKWPRHRVIEAIQNRYVQGLPMIGNQDHMLASAAKRAFGSWYDAMVAAGIPVREKPTPRRQWTSEGMIQAIIALQGQRSKTTNIEKIDSGLVTTARRRFGTWHNALLAAGMLPPDAQPLHAQQWPKKRVITEIQRRGRRGDSLREDAVGKRLACAAARYFGSWRRAVLAAGLAKGDS